MEMLLLKVEGIRMMLEEAMKRRGKEWCLKEEELMGWLEVEMGYQMAGRED